MILITRYHHNHHGGLVTVGERARAYYECIDLLYSQCMVVSVELHRCTNREFHHQGYDPRRNENV